MESSQPLNPIAVDFGPFHIHWYGIFIGVGLLLGWIIASKQSDKMRLPKDIFSDLLLWVVPLSIIGARLYYVIFEWEYYSQNPGEIIAIWEGGLAIHGALIGGVISAIVFCKRLFSMGLLLLNERQTMLIGA